MVDLNNDLAPDLEWMLLSRQTDQAMIVESLVEGFDDPLYRLALSLLEDPKDAREAVLQTYVDAVRTSHRYQGGCGVQVWLFQNLLRLCQQITPESRHSHAAGARRSLEHTPLHERGAVPQTEAEARLWQDLNALPEKDALPLRLRFAFGLSGPEIAQALRLNEREARARLKSAWEKIAASLASASSWDEVLALEDLPRTEQGRFLAESLKRRWPAPDPAQEPAGRLRLEVEQRLLLPEKKHPWIRPAKRLALQASGLLLIAAVAWLSFRVAPGEEIDLSLPRPKAAAQVIQHRNVPPFSDESKVDGWPPRPAWDEGGAAWSSLAGLPARLLLKLPLSFVDLTTANPPDDLNNSGAIELSRVLKYWDQPVDLTKLTRDLQPSPSDPNVMPYELAEYVRENTELRSVLRMGGDFALLARFINAGFPVILEKGYEWDSYTGWLGHYVIAKGFDQDKKGTITLSSSLAVEPTPVLDTRQLQEEWRAFNYLYLVVYPAEKESDVLRILGPQDDPGYNYRYATEIAAREVAHLTGKDLFFALFNLGTNLNYLRDYQGAAHAFDRAFQVYTEIVSPYQQRPWRMLWYSSRPYQAYYLAGRYQDVIRLANQTIDTAKSYELEESFYWRALARKALGDSTGAVADLKKALEINPNFKAGAYQLSRSSSGGESYAVR